MTLAHESYCTRSLLKETGHYHCMVGPLTRLLPEDRHPPLSWSLRAPDRRTDSAFMDELAAAAAVLAMDVLIERCETSRWRPECQKEGYRVGCTCNVCYECSEGSESEVESD